MRILFLYPALISGWASYKENGNNESSYMDHGFAMLSAVLKRAGHQTFSMDLRSFQSWEHFESTLKLQTFDFTLVSFFSANERFARQAVEIVKRNFPDKYIIGGGIHLSVTKTREYPNIDSIVLGEGESHILNIADTISRGEKPAPVYELEMIKDLDSLPWVDRELFNPRMEQTSPLLPGLPQPFITIVAGRGCWGKCTFCAPSRNLISGDKIRIRSVDNFISELASIAKIYGLGSVMIHDDLLGSKKWLGEFVEQWNKNLPSIPWWCQLRADTIIKMREFIPLLANIGLTYVSVGLESGSPRMLEFLQKGVTVEQNIEACEILHESGINIFSNYIVGLPTETDEDLQLTGKMLSKIRPAFHSASTYTSYPGSYIYEWIKANDYWAYPEEHYCQTRYPYERKIKGVDYEKIAKIGADWRAAYTGELRTPKKLSKVTSVNLPASTPEKEVLPGSPLVSVIIITYNRPQFLRNAIESVFSQTFTDWELLVMDYTEDWDINKEVLDWAAKDKRVRWHAHKKNINNISVCWNEALDLIRGQYWCTLDDDNVKYPHYLEKMVDFLENNPQHLAVVCPMEHTGTTKGIHFQKPESFEKLKIRNHIDSGQVLWRKSIIEAIGMFDERLTALEDWDYMLRAFALNNFLGSAFGWLDSEPLCSYHWHDKKRMFTKFIDSVAVECENIIATKQIKNTLKVAFYTTGDNGRTESQKQLGDNVYEALKSIPFVEIVNHSADLAIIMGPLYNFTFGDMEIFKLEDNPNAEFVGLLCEDPQALHGNLNYIKYLDWIVTNDTNAYNYYLSKLEGKKKNQVLHWNNLSISNRLLDFIQGYNPEKQYDICFIGYPYKSRFDFLQKLIPLLHGVKILLIGDLWQNWKDQATNNAVFKLPKNNVEITVYPTLDEIETARLAMQSKIILLKHRTATEGFPIIDPGCINRGYIEAAYRAHLLLDNDRQHSTIPQWLLTWYNDASKCARAIEFILQNYDMPEMQYKVEMLYNKAIESFTMRTRLIKILNCIRSIRYNKKIE